MTGSRNTRISPGRRARWSQARARWCMAAGMLLLAAMIAREILWPEQIPAATTLPMLAWAGGGQARFSGSDSIGEWQGLVEDRRLFKPALPLPSRSVAQQSVERIKGLLSLHGIVELNGEKVAYVQIKGEGLKSLRAGDSVEDMFTVTCIEGRVVELDIVGERVMLGM